MYLNSSGSGVSGSLLTSKAVLSDGESQLAATLRRTQGAADVGPHSRVPAPPAEPQHSKRAAARSVTADMLRAVEARLPGRIRELRIDIEKDQYVLRGTSSSYYVKQVAGHLAMTTMDARVLGRLVNEIEVRSIR
jgi:hypothetical protein